jgi:glycosyltransferase involved in cell wall biosynthesis
MATLNPRIVIVTAGHLSTTPRMLKAADALHAAGYRVRVVSANHTKWAQTADRAVMATRRWHWTVVDYSRESAGLARITTGARFKAAHAVSSTIGASRVPAAVAVRAYSRAHDELVRAIVSEDTDLIYGGTTGALAAVAEAALDVAAPYGIDLEDLHSAEDAGDDSDHVQALAARIERDVIDGAQFVTASSPLISDAYARMYGVAPTTVHNTFSIGPPRAERDRRPERPLRLYWFSQTIGPGRGLEEVIAAAGSVKAPIELHLRGRSAEGYFDQLRTLQRDAAPSLSLVHHDPAPPDEMVALAQDYDVGLSCEEPATLNHRFCLGNKIFTYLAAGVPVVLSRTPAQWSLAADLGDAAAVYPSGDVDALAGVVRGFLTEARRASAQRAAIEAAERRWHWEHPLDRGALLERVAEVAPAR